MRCPGSPAKPVDPYPGRPAQTRCYGGACADERLAGPPGVLSLGPKVVHALSGHLAAAFVDEEPRQAVVAGIQISLHRPEFVAIKRLVRGEPILEPAHPNARLRQLQVVAGETGQLGSSTHAGTRAAPTHSPAPGACLCARRPASGPSLPGSGSPSAARAGPPSQQGVLGLIQLNAVKGMPNCVLNGVHD